MSHWIASVISYSPRHDGSSVSAASRIESSNRYTPTSARSLTYDAGFSTRRTTRSPSSTATPNRSGSGTCARKIWASGRVRSNSSTNRPSPSSSTLSPRYIRNGWPATKSRAVRTACARPERRLLLDVGDRESPRRAVSDRGADLVAGLPDHDADLGDAGIADRLERVEQDRRPRHGDQLLRVRVGERPQSRSFASRQDQRAHQVAPRIRRPARCNRWRASRCRRAPGGSSPR